MKVPKQLNVTRLVALPTEPAWLQACLDRLALQFRRVADSIPGPSRFEAGELGAVDQMALGLGDLVTATLTQDTAIAIVMDQRAGAEGLLELTQDAVGGHAVTWTNVLWTNSTPPVVAAGIGKRTLIGFTCRGDAWVGRVLATNY